MQSYIVLTATGPDRTGLVDTVTDRIVAFAGNVELSRMARLGGEFAMLALISTPEDRVEALLAALAGLEEEGLRASAHRTETATVARYEGHEAFEVRVTGADHSGIIHEVAHYLGAQGINIEAMDTDVSDAPLSGAPLFSMSAQVCAPSGLTLDDLRGALDAVGDELGVDTEVLPFRDGQSPR